MRNPRYRVTKDGMFLIRLKDEKKISIPSPIKLRNYGGLRSQLDVGTDGAIQTISRSCIDESEFTLGDPPVFKNGKKPKKAANGKVHKSVAPKKTGGGLLSGAYEFYSKKVQDLEEQLLRAKQVVNRLAYDMGDPQPYPEE